MTAGGAAGRRSAPGTCAATGDGADPVHRKVAGARLGVLIVSAVGVSLVGHIQGQIMTKQQPMKMAAAEALWDTKTTPSFSLFAYGDVEQGKNKIDIAIPDGLSILATNHPGGTVAGHQRRPGGRGRPSTAPAATCPIVWLAYWMLPADDRLRRARRR